MDEFPPDFNRAKCTEVMKLRQAELIKEVRQNFYNVCNLGIDQCDKQIELVFPDNLWYESRLTITSELLKRFGEVKVMNPQGDYKVERMTNDLEQVPKNTKKIMIEF